MYRDMTGADIGICYGGAWRNGTNGHFYKGDITDTSLNCVRPDKESTDSEDPWAATIVTSTMTGAQILDVLNNGTGISSSGGTVGECRYYVAAGLTVKFDPWAAEGSRVLSCKTPDGEDLDPDATYQVAYFFDSLPESIAVTPESSLEQTWQESFLSWLDQQGGVVKEPDLTIELAYGEAG
jgi:hypothetical protein